jgi:hypothetical protein
MHQQVDNPAVTPQTKATPQPGQTTVVTTSFAPIKNLSLQIKLFAVVLCAETTLQPLAGPITLMKTTPAF